MKKCPRCGTFNAEADQWCQNCGCGLSGERRKEGNASEKRAAKDFAENGEKTTGYANDNDRERLRRIYGITFTNLESEAPPAGGKAAGGPEGIRRDAGSEGLDKTARPCKPVKRKIGVIAGIAVALAAVAALAVVLLKPAGSDVSEAITRRIENEIVFAPEPPLEYQYSNSILRAISFRVKSRNMRAGSAVVQFRYVDVMALADSLGNSVVDQADYYTRCVEAIQSGSAPYAEKTITVEFEKRTVNGAEQLCVVDSLELADVISGGTVSAYIRAKEGLS